MILKGFYDRFKDIVSGETDSVTVSVVSDKVGLDVNIIGGSAGGGAGGDASAANQTTQITEAQATNTKLDTLIAGQSTSTATSTEAKQDANIAAVQDLLEIPVHTHYRLTYVTSGNGVGEVETITYYTGGTGAEVLVQTRTFTYDASNRVTLMEKS